MDDKKTVSPEELAVQDEYAAKVGEILSFRFQDRNPLALVRSYGCQQNVSDGEKIKGILAKMGYGFCDEPADADLILYNTCAVRKHAEDRVFGNAGALKELRIRKKGMVIALCGCMMQQPHVAEKIKKSFSYINLVFGTHVLHTLPQMLYNLFTTGKRQFDTTQSDGIIAEGLPVKRDSTEKAWVPVMYGCDNFCSYCVVPYVRGRERSRDTGDVVSEVTKLTAEGYNEITLLGQNVNSYRGECDFAGLLHKLNEIEGNFTIDFMTSHPKDAKEDLINAIAQCGKVRKHLHLPVQSGSDKILKAMNRGYTAEQYLSVINMAKERVPGITFSSDIIVGFPGEEYEDFLQTLELIKTVKFKQLFTFIYSKREGTKAAQMQDNISLREKKRWFMQLLETQKAIEDELQG